MAEDEDVWRKLAPYDKVSHANWKCRKAGYEELMKELPKLGGYFFNSIKTKLKIYIFKTYI